MSSSAFQGVYLGTGFDLAEFYGPSFAAYEPEITLRPPDAIADPAAVRFAVCWHPQAEDFARFPNLELLCAPGAGVDGLLGSPGLPEGVPICRLRDADQAAQMAGFAAHEVLHVERGFARIAEDVRHRHWRPIVSRAPSEVVTTVLGHGNMGCAVARALVALGFSVRVASRSEPAERIKGVQYHCGPDAVTAAAEGADFVINVLPLTAATRGVLNAGLFARMARGSWLVQIGRGEHLIEADLVAALDAGVLSGASLDVFATEPLPPDHPFWQDPRLRLSPHVASIADPAAAARQIVQSAREQRDGKPLSFAIERDRGY